LSPAPLLERHECPLACATVSKKYLSDIANRYTTPALPICPDTKWLGSKRLKA
jgi:hypothetical protein